MELSWRGRALACGLSAIVIAAATGELCAQETPQRPPGAGAGSTVPFEVRVQQHLDEGRYEDAERLYRGAIEKLERKHGRDAPAVATGLKNLAFIFHLQGRYADAEPLYVRALAIRKAAFGDNDPQVALVLSQLAEVYQAQRRFDDAERLNKQAVQIFERTRGTESLDAGLGYNNLARLYLAQRRYEEAEVLFLRALRIFEKVRGPIHSDVALACNNLALVYQARGRYADAVAYFTRALAIFRAPGRDNPEVAVALRNLAALYAEQRQWSKALDYYGQAVKIVVDRMRTGAQSAAAAGGAGHALDTPWNRTLFESFLSTAWERARELPASEPALADDSFTAAQWMRQTSAATALAQMATREANGTGALSGLVRQSQDLAAAWTKLDKQLLASLSASTPQPGSDTGAELRSRLAAIEQQMGEVDARLAREFPEYYSLIRPAPLSFADLRQQLGANEALIQVTVAGSGAFAWAVTRDRVRWVRLAVGAEAIAEKVQRLRCGLDASNWTDPGKWSEASEADKLRKQEQLGRRERCMRLTGTEVAVSAALPFDLAAAHELYQNLFGQLEDLIGGKQLLMVTSGHLASLPFQVLVTARPGTAIPPDPARYAEAAWLAKSHAVSVVPSVASLKALRQFARSSKAASPFIGFGNPLLTGRDGSDRRAFARQMCPDIPSAARITIAGWEVPESLAHFFRGGLGDVERLRRQQPLPETADELCEVARLLGAKTSDVNLGANATETRVKTLSGDGDLATYAVVHLATHGLLAAETGRIVKTQAEPALMLTPPETATETDDGLLTTSEVSQLKLDADWVVLSACNTAAAGEAGDAEALSGLGRAFFYAGARALLVSHWYVDSRAAVKLTTGAFTELRNDPTIGRAEALRRAMLAVAADSARPSNWVPAGHPAVWAPFVVVGEGAK